MSTMTPTLSQLRRSGLLTLWLLGSLLLAAPLADAASRSTSMTDEQLLEQARTHIQHQAFSSAIVLYNVYLSRHPHDDEIRGRLAQAMAWNKQYPAALRLYSELLQRHPNDHDLRTAYGRILAWTGQHQAAEEAFTRVLRADPTRRDTREALGDLYRWSGRDADAAAIYRSLLNEAPTPELETKLAALARPAEPLAGHPATSSSSVTPIVPTPQTSATNRPVSTTPSSPATAQTEPVLPYRQFVTIGYAHSLYTKDIPDDHTAFLEGGLPIGRATAVGRYEQIHRFRFDDPQIGAELYSPLWTGAWGVAHGTVGPGARIIPQWSAGGSLHQSLAPIHPSLAPWEPFVGYQHLHFTRTAVHIISPGFTWYFPHNVWMTETLYLVPDTGASTLMSQLTWRPLPRLQTFIAGGFGTQGERLTAQMDIQRITTRVYKAGVEFPLSSHWSAGLVITHEDRETLYRRQEGRVFLSYVW